MILHKKHISCNKIENELKSYHNKTDWAKFCADAGFLTTVEIGQCFMTKDTAEFSQFTDAVACREYTLPRDEEASEPQGWMAREMGSPRQVQNRRRRTREGPEPACVRAPLGVAHAGGEGRINVLPWYRPVGVAIPPVNRDGGRAGLPKKGKWPPHGTETTVLPYPCPSQPCSGGSQWCASVTGKAGENGQYSGEMGGSSPWTRPSAPECGDTLKAPAGDQRPI